jgi:hypothetical protein
LLVSGPVPLNFLPPVSEIGGGHPQVPWTTVPEAAVNKDYSLDGNAQEVWLTWNATRVRPKTANSGRSECFQKPFF